jgi:hypothetical protein
MSFEIPSKTGQKTKIDKRAAALRDNLRKRKNLKKVQAKNDKEQDNA